MKIDSCLRTFVLSERSELNGILVDKRAFIFNTTTGTKKSCPWSMVWATILVVGGLHRWRDGGGGAREELRKVKSEKWTVDGQTSCGRMVSERPKDRQAADGQRIVDRQTRRARMVNE